MDESGGEEVIVVADGMVEAGWDAAGAAVYFSGGGFVCAGDRKIAGQKNAQLAHFSVFQIFLSYSSVRDCVFTRQF